MPPPAELPAWLLWMGPVLFLLHDSEEVIWLPGWLCRNREKLTHRFPQVSQLVYGTAGPIPQTHFTWMACEELVLFTAATVCALRSHGFVLWLALFLAFALHLLVHAAQGIVLRRYVPALATTLICLPLCGLIFVAVIRSRLFTGRETVLCAVAGCTVAAVNLAVMHRVCAAVRRRRANRG